MVETSTLLDLLRFVALIAPVLAVLMQVVMKMEDDRSITIGPVSVDELKILQLSMLFVLLGGCIIGIRLIDAVDDATVSAGMLLIFGGLPFSAVAVFLMANKSASGTPGSISLVNQIASNLEQALSIMIVAGLPTLLYFIIFRVSEAWFNQNLDIGFLHSSLILPSYLLAVSLVTMSVKALLTSRNYNITSWRRAVNLGFRNAIYLPVVFAVFVVPVYFIPYLLTNWNLIGLGVEKENFLLNIPHLWFVIVCYVLIIFEYDPFSNES